MRQLGDLAFLLRQYAFAESTYRLAAQVRAPGRVGVNATDPIWVVVWVAWGQGASVPRRGGAGGGAEEWYAQWVGHGHGVTAREFCVEGCWLTWIQAQDP